MRVACLIDTKGKVQHNRINVFASLLPEFSFDIIVATKRPKINPKKYDTIYYASFALFDKCPIRHRNLCGSVTSHKCLMDMKKTINILNKFNKVSVNNNILRSIFSAHLNNVFYIPNGVDTDMFKFKGDTQYDTNNIRLGWVGNTDRATKNYSSIIIPMLKWTKFHWSIIGTKKSKPLKRKLVNMPAFYHNLDFYIVSSSTEGTPNPALEAAACGVPVISTMVGNMPDVIDDGINGFLVNETSLDAFRYVLEKRVFAQTKEEYQSMSRNIRTTIEQKWSWESRKDHIIMFLTN